MQTWSKLFANVMLLSAKDKESPQASKELKRKIAAEDIQKILMKF